MHPTDTRLDLPPAQRDLLRVLQAAAAGLAPAAPPANWAEVLDLAALHQVERFLYPLMLEWPPASRPAAPLMARCRTSFLGAAARHVRVAVQMQELLSALVEAGVRVIPLKGVWLAERVYADAACRPMCDIDLLVPPEDLHRARAVFERLGYATAAGDAGGEDAHHVCYQRPRAPMPIELHWSLWDTGNDAVGRPDPSNMWAGLREELLHGVPLRVFPPERHLVHLAQHILKHRLTVPARAYLDLVLLCRRYAPSLDLELLEHEARAWRVAFGTRFVLQVAFELLGGSPPAALTPFLATAGGSREARRAALRATLLLTPESKQLSLPLVAFQRSSGIRRLGIGLARWLLAPARIRRGYARAVRRWGLAGGYVARGADLLRRHGRSCRPPTGEGAFSDADLANFSTRRSLSAWLLEQEPARPPQAAGTRRSTPDARQRTMPPALDSRPSIRRAECDADHRPPFTPTHP